jgi:hypothetical protein
MFFQTFSTEHGIQEDAFALYTEALFGEDVLNVSSFIPRVSLSSTTYLKRSKPNN